MAPEIYLKLERYQEQGWQWSESYTDAAGRQVAGRYRTSPAGDGLWKYDRANGRRYEDGSLVYEYRQIESADTFWLPQAHRRAYDKIRNRILAIRR